jgi:CRISPR-associated endonuclease Csn1
VLDEKLAAHQIGRTLFHLNQRRGFKSDRKTDRVSNANEDGKIAIEALVGKKDGARTLIIRASQHEYV